MRRLVVRWTWGAAVTASLLVIAPARAHGAPQESPAAAEGEQAVEWLKDEKGREYRVEKLPKAYPHQRLEDGRLRTVWGIVVDLAGEDEKDFFVKMYRTAAPERPAAPRGLTAEQKAAVAASYAHDAPTAETLRFEPFDDGLPRSGQWRNRFALADLDGDGHLDVVHGPARKRPGPPVVFRGDSKGHWRRWSEVSFPRQVYDYGAAAVADFDGDGRPDLALGMHLRGVTALRNEGGGRFAAYHEGMDVVGDRQNPAFSSRALATLDWDGDGRIDVLALAEGPRLMLGQGGPRGAQGSTGVVLYRNRGDGTWEKKHGASRLFGDSVAPLRTSGGKTAFVTGTAVRGLDEVVFLPGGDPWTARPLGLRPGALVWSVAVADFDGDGRDDVATGYAAYEGEQWRSGIDVYRQRPDGWDRRTVHVEEARTGVTAIAAGDLNRDGLPDLVGLTGDGRTLVFVATGKGAFSREPTSLTTLSTGCRGYHAAVADLDGDGYGDLVAAFAGEPEGMAMLQTPGCPGEGSLRAWRTQPVKTVSSEPRK